SHVRRSVALIHPDHLRDERGQPRWLLNRQRRVAKWALGRVSPAQEVMEGGSQTVDVGARRRLCFSIALRSQITGCADEDSIFGLSRFEEPSEPKINPIHVAAVSEDYIGGFKITEDNRRLMRMQVVKYGCKLKPNLDYLMYRQPVSWRSADALFQC